MALKLQSAPAASCLTLAEAKLHLRVDVSEDDLLIQALIDAATQDAEHLMQRAVMPQKWLLTLDSFGGIDATALSSPSVVYVSSSINLPRPPVTAVDSVQYVAAATGVLTTLSPSAYLLDAGSDLVGRLTPVYGTSWPATRVQLAAVQIIFSCGWANAALVPAIVKQWILLRIAALYENREAWSTKPLLRNEFLDQLLDRYRVFTL
jgi:uncharacterized phiE125 gp8 family phage protein